MELLDQIRFFLESYAGGFGRPNETVSNRGAVRKTAEGRKHPGIGFVASQSEPGGDMQGKLMPAMGNTAAKDHPQSFSASIIRRYSTSP
jgi:hypothetical protein